MKGIGDEAGVSHYSFGLALVSLPGRLLEMPRVEGFGYHFDAIGFRPGSKFSWEGEAK
jgi:hypothetical protein